MEKLNYLPLMWRDQMFLLIKKTTNKKILLGKCKRHTTRCIASAHHAAVS